MGLYDERFSRESNLGLHAFYVCVWGQCVYCIQLTIMLHALKKRTIILHYLIFVFLIIFPKPDGHLFKSASGAEYENANHSSNSWWSSPS